MPYDVRHRDDAPDRHHAPLSRTTRATRRPRAGTAPHCLLDYFPEDFLLVIDESHVTVPQIGGMYEGDMSRKRTLVEHGFRLPSAMDNRPLRWRSSWSGSPDRLPVRDPGAVRAGQVRRVRRAAHPARPVWSTPR